jgi:hypothetical protein
MATSSAWDFLNKLSTNGDSTNNQRVAVKQQFPRHFPGMQPSALTVPTNR